MVVHVQVNKIKMVINDLKEDLRKNASENKAEVLGRFFKTGVGEYGEGDIFLGVVMPDVRKVVSKYWKSIDWVEIEELLNSKIHEERMVGLLILVQLYERKESDQEKICEYYLSKTKQINNWDLVDLTAEHVVGEYCRKRRNIDKLRNLAKSELLWDRRIAVLSCFAFIKKGSEKEIFEIADLVLNDNHDLIQKAVGWMLREVGKRVSLETEESFLKGRYKKMPRTSLRYAIERFDEETRLAYLNGLI